MKSLKSYIVIFVAVACCFMVTGCLQGPDNTYSGPTVAAFKMQSSQVKSISANAKERGVVALQVQIIRPKQGVLSQDLPINFVVVDSLTTATSPDDYTIATPSPVTVPADCLKTNIIITYDGSTIPAGDAHHLTLQLTGNQSRGVKGAEVIGKYKLTIVGQ